MKTLFITFALIAQTLAALGTTVGTPASAATSALQSVIAKYLTNGGDINTLSMNKIIEMIDVERADATTQGKFEDRFEILGGRGPVNQVTMAKMIAYTANQIGKERGDVLGRYVIWLAGEEVNYTWESEEKVTALLGGVGIKLVDRGVWLQSNTKSLNMFHVGIRKKPLPDDNRVQEDLYGRRLSQSNTQSQNEQQQNAAQQVDTMSQRAFKPGEVSEEPVATSWNMWVVIIVASIGLLTLLLKRMGAK